MSQEFSVSDIEAHNSKKDLYLIIHDKVYNTSSFVDEHPGGEEVLLDVGGQDATEAFEDVGHSDEAREILEGLLVGTVKRAEGEKKPTTAATNKIAAGPSKTSDSSSGVVLYAALVLGAAVAYGAYTYLQSSDKK